MLGTASILAVVSVNALGNAQDGDVTRTRQEFANAMASVSKGMTVAEVRRILGDPDDVRTEYDPGGIRMRRTKEIWCYGTHGHLTFPTLGCVYIDEDGQALYIYGGGDAPPAPTILDERTLRSLLPTINRAPGLFGHSYNPRAIIRIVNALQPLGKKRALAAVDEYLRVVSPHDRNPRDGLFLVLRVLFDVPKPPGYMPRMLVGAPGPAEPEDREHWPIPGH